VPACLVELSLSLDARSARKELPDRLTDQEFWKLSVDSSEPDGTFRSDNLVSNEVWLQYVIPDLLKTVRPGGVYFVSRLFSRPRPDGIDERSTAAGIFEAFSQVERQQSLHDETLGTIRQQLADRAADAQGRLLVDTDRLLERIALDVLDEREVERHERHDPTRRKSTTCAEISSSTVF